MRTELAVMARHKNRLRAHLLSRAAVKMVVSLESRLIQSEIRGLGGSNKLPHCHCFFLALEDWPKLCGKLHSDAPGSKLHIRSFDLEILCRQTEFERLSERPCRASHGHV